MSHLWVCDNCQYQQATALPYEVIQITDETDDDGTALVETLHLCSSQCLSDFAMGLSLDFPEEPITKET
jgi:hypothetical protein